MEKTTVSCKIQDKDIIFETGMMARQANGSVLCCIGDTKILAAATMSNQKSNADFFPLTVNYIEKYYAAGKFPGGFFKREAKPRDKEILIARLTDRPIRPLFDDGFRNEVQIVSMTFSVDNINPQDIVAINAASCALIISDIPFHKPVGAVRVGFKDGNYLINPTFEEIDTLELDLIVAGTQDAIMMVEGGCTNVTEDVLMGGIKEAHSAIKLIIEAQQELQKKVGKPKKEVELFEVDKGLEQKIRDAAYNKLQEASNNSDKNTRSENVKAIYKEIIEQFTAQVEEDQLSHIGIIVEKLEKEIVRKQIFEKEIRADGRSLDEIRDIDCQIDIFNVVHGSALFTRGQTQSLAITTLGSKKDEQIIDDLEGDARKSFLLHYNFPPFSVGEVGRMGFTSRREIGHGHLAERSLLPVLPDKEKFQYTIRVVSEILESNGSSSMASVCSSNLSMLAAGVPLTDNVAGIAMGLIYEDNNFKILTDIQGLEDHLGDMDFKVAGTRTGITGFQMDIKIQGITFEIMETALEKAKKARLAILDKMEAVISKPKDEVSKSAPRYEQIRIQQDVIKNLIGPGGKNIKAIVERTGSDLDIDDNGTVHVYAKNQEMLVATIKEIEVFTKMPVVGEIYEGTVKRIVDFGAFIEILPGLEGLCHISEFTPTRLRSVNDFTKEGATITVKVINIDNNGKVKLSHKAAITPLDKEE